MNKTLKSASPSVQVAVDIIQILEQNEILNDIAIQALEIALNDFRKKKREYDGRRTAK
ncbi:DUF2496 domain-containing protein [Psychromonas sp. CD1]|uniref:DUF2496 domain-containing protein n=1 Tax=Psychromonas sp. CD1 TaxID=1979839 RepID=UPI000B9ACDB0|nr:DUF2496 domain-containing protein [Psychromonas sp. CD1]